MSDIYIGMTHEQHSALMKSLSESGELIPCPECDRLRAELAEREKERDNWMEDARARACNTDYWREKAEHLERELAERDATIIALRAELASQYATVNDLRELREFDARKLAAERQRARLPEELVTALRHALDMEHIGGPREKLFRDLLAWHAAAEGAKT